MASASRRAAFCLRRLLIDDGGEQLFVFCCCRAAITRTRLPDSDPADASSNDPLSTPNVRSESGKRVRRDRSAAAAEHEPAALPIVDQQTAQAKMQHDAMAEPSPLMLRHSECGAEHGCDWADHRAAWTRLP